MASTTPRPSRIPAGVRTDVPVLVAVLVCWLVLPIFLAHVLTGVAMTGIIAVHLRTRWGRVRRLFRSRRPRTSCTRRAAYWIFLAATVAMVVSGVLRWFGVPPAYAQHASASYVMLTAAAVHMIVVRRALGARLRVRSPSACG